MSSTGGSGKVSIVTPVYNGERYIRRFLESILVQTWNQLEILLVDDGSEDQSMKIAWSFHKKFQERGVNLYIIYADHKNASAAINHALPLVTGEFLIWPDSDDVLEPNSIRRRVEFLQANPQYQCVRSLSRYCNEDGTPCQRRENIGDLDKEELFFPVLTGESFVCCGCYMLRSAAFFSIYPKRKIPEYEVGQNFQMLLPFLYTHRCPTIREELYTVYVRPDSHSCRPLTKEEDEKKYSDFEALVDEIAEICKISDSKELLKIELWKQRRRYTIAIRYNKKKKAMAALLWLYIHGNIEFWHAFKEAVKLICGPRICRIWRKLRTREEKK